MRFIKLAAISPFILYVNIFHATNLRSEIKVYSIVKKFCKESVKSEFKKSSFEYEENIGENICNCYVKNISKNISHKESISKCKLEKFKKN